MDEKIFEIKELLKQRRTPLIKEKLEELQKDLEKLENLQKFLDEIKKIIRELGRSTMLDKSKIEEAINEYER